MPNPVAANDLSPISGSLQTSRISYGVETAGKNYGQNYNSSYWYSDIPNNGQFYTIISDNYTANYYVSRSNAEGAYVEGGLPAVDEYSAPVFWVTAGTSSLDVITTVNGLPDRIGQVPFNSGSQALNWIASSSNYFAVGPDYYAQIDADNLIFCVEGNQVISYPTTGSTWYDLSGYFMKGALTNGTTWNSNDYMIFDGTDDYINFGNNSVFNVGTTGSLSIDILFKTIDTTGALVTKRLGSGPQVYVFSNKLYADGGGTAGVSSANNVNNNRWTRGTVVYDRASSLLRLYVNGVADNTTAFGATTLTDTSDLYLGTALLGSGVPHDFYTGSIAEVLIYPKALSTTEISQNYYGGPIVTTDLYSMLDASNLVSYPKTGTTAYELVSSGAGDGSLTNGPTFTTAFGGGWIMDGVDDYLRTSVDSNAITPTNSWTVSIWCSLNSYPTITGSPKEGILFGYALYGGLGIYAISSTTGTVNVYGYFRSDSAVDIFGSYVWTLNTPTMFTLVHEAGVGCKFYVNDQLNYNYPGMTGGNWPGYMSLPFDLFSPQNGVYGGGSNTYIYYPITTYSTQVYLDKALTSAEILQNYNATK
jgi:hypothetical protein